jgi:type IV secretory pathway VirB4 component
VALKAVQHERQGLHQVIVAIAVEGRNRDELEQHVQLLASTAAHNQIYLRLARMHQLEATTFFTPKPIPDSIAQASRNLISSGVALFSPFGFETNKDTRGPFVAINRGVGAPLWLDKFSLPAYNEVVLGRTGSGKTFMAGLRAYRARMFGVQTIFIDPQGSFRKVTEAVEGSYNLLRLGEGTALNILDVVHDSAAAQISHVIVLLESLLGRPLTIREKGTVDQALYHLYGRCQVRTDRFDADKMPRLEDLLSVLQKPEGSYPPAPDLADDLDRFVHGSLRSIFNAHTTLSLDLDRRYPLITFDVSDLEGEFQPIFIFTLLSAIERVTRQRRAHQSKTNIVVDEFGILSQIPALAEATGLLAKRVRAWKVGIQCLDQNWDTFDTPAGRRILENSLVKVVMRVDETAAPAIVGNLGLTGRHAEVILSAGIGEGVMLIGSKPYHVFFEASRSEIEMLTPYGQRPGTHWVALPTRKQSL